MEEYEEINLGELIHIVLEKWWIAAVFAVLAIAVSAYVTSQLIDPVYEARSTLFIGNESDSIVGISFNDLQLDDQLVVDYQELIKTRLVTESVIEELNLNTTVETFVSHMTVTAIKDSRFIHIAFRDTNPVQAASITNLLSNALVENAERIVGVENVMVVDTAVIPGAPISPNLRMNVAIAGLLGAMLGLFLIMLLHMLDNTFKREDDIERHLGLTVLGVVPRFEPDRRVS